MITFLEYIFFICFTIFSFLKALSYGIYEIKENKNKVGGSFVIFFGLFATIFSNMALILGD